MADLETLTGHVTEFLTATTDARHLSERDRDYYDHKHWTAAEEAKLKGRNQAAITVNRIKPKVEGLIGLYLMRLSDPKAYPRTKKHEKAAIAVTDALRFVADETDFVTVKSEVAENFFIEGYGGAIIDVRQTKKGEMKISVRDIPWDRIYFDKHSRRKDFSDSRYFGIMLWYGEEELRGLLLAGGKSPKQIDEIIEAALSSSNAEDETFQDRPRWVEKKERRIRVALEFYLHDGVWHQALFTDGVFLSEPEPSPFLDEEGEPMCPIELVSANIDRDNNRYGEVRAFISQQDEINHRRSKALHLLSVRQTFGRVGSPKDVARLKRELAKPDGHVVFEGGDTFGKDFGILPTGDMAEGQLALYQDAKAELDAISINAQLAGERQQGDLSGRAIEKLQSAGALELNRQYMLLNGWEKRVYRQIWLRIRQFWTDEKWVRVTDDQDSLRWVGLNTQVTAQQWMEEQINDDSLDLKTRRQIAASYQFLMNAAKGPAPELVQAARQGDENAIAAVQKAQQVQPVAQAKLEEIVAVSNDVAELEVDVILDQSFDTVNAQQEQFNMLMQFAQGSRDIDIIELIEISQLRGKDELIEKIEKRRAAAAQAAGNMQQIQVREAQAKTAETLSKAKLNEQKAIQIYAQNYTLANDPNRGLSQQALPQGDAG